MQTQQNEFSLVTFLVVVAQVRRKVENNVESRQRKWKRKSFSACDGVVDLTEVVIDDYSQLQYGKSSTLQCRVTHTHTLSPRQKKIISCTYYIGAN